MRSRWNWGVLTSQVPWLTGSTISHGTVGEPKIVRETDVLREVHRQIHGAAVYPFSSAKRLELSGGLQAIGFGSQTVTSEYSGFTGQLMNQTTVNNPADPTLWLGESHAALVYDTATFGPTSPILGRRYRFAVAPTFGGLTFTTVTSDYRQYWMPLKPFTVAIRVMHLGRYGTDAADARLLPLVWTIRDIVRGYGDLGPGPSSLGTLERLTNARRQWRSTVSDCRSVFACATVWWLCRSRGWHLQTSDDSGCPIVFVARLPCFEASEPGYASTPLAWSSSWMRCAASMWRADGRFPSTCAPDSDPA